MRDDSRWWKRYKYTAEPPVMTALAVTMKRIIVSRVFGFLPQIPNSQALGVRRVGQYRVSKNFGW
jgi:hypothetical protein